MTVIFSYRFNISAGKDNYSLDCDDNLLNFVYLMKFDLEFMSIKHLRRTCMRMGNG